LLSSQYITFGLYIFSYIWFIVILVEIVVPYDYMTLVLHI